MESEASNVVSVSWVQAYWYSSRLRSFFSRTLNQGLGPFFLFSVSLVALFLDIRIVRQSAEEDRAYVQNLISVETPPASADQHAAVLSLLLVGLDSPSVSGALYCPERDPKGSCLMGRLLMHRTQALLTHLADKNSLQSETAFGFDARRYAQLLEKNINDRRAILPQTPKSILTTAADNECKIDAEHARRTSVFSFAEPQCEDLHDDISAGVVPQQVADALMNPATPPTVTTLKNANSVDLRDYRVRRAVLDSRLFDVALRSLSVEIDNTERDENDKPVPTLAAAYFVTVDSVIRYTNFLQPALRSELPPYKLWAGREYIEKLVQKVETRRDVSTRAYIDFAGSGIVYTTCRAVFAGNNDPIVSTSGVIGAVCLDYSLSERGILALTHAVDDGAITRAVSLKIHREAGTPWEFAEPTVVPRWARSTEVTRQLDGVVREIASNPENQGDVRALDEILDETSTDDRHQKKAEEGFSKANDVRPLSQTKENIFLVPTGVDKSGDLVAILLSVEGIGPFGSRPWPTFLAVVFAGLVIGAFVAGASTSKELAEREGILSRLRSLQIAVIQTNSSDDRVTAANDRAEDLIGQALPAFGLRESRISMTFWDLFDEESLCMTPEMSHLSPMPRFLDEATLKRVNLRTIKAAREAGRTTSYFGRLRMQRHNALNSACAHQWLKITAGPIFQPGRFIGSQDVTSHFGTIEILPSEFAKVLDQFIRSAIAERRNV